MHDEKMDSRELAGRCIASGTTSMGIMCSYQPTADMVWLPSVSSCHFAIHPVLLKRLACAILASPGSARIVRDRNDLAGPNTKKDCCGSPARQMSRDLDRNRSHLGAVLRGNWVRLITGLL